MNRRALAEAAAWMLVALTLAASTLAWLEAGSLPAAEEIPGPETGPPGAPAALAADTLRVAALALIDGNPFRLARRPAAAAFERFPRPEPPVAAAEPPRQRPRLALAGTVGGPPWLALLEGVPGREAGLLASAGDTVGELRILAAGRDTAVVAGPDTTWVLTLKRPWR